jgi:hypothetical protein
MAETSEFNNGDKYYGRICGNPDPHEKLEPPTYAGITRESAAKYIEAGKKSLAFDVEDVGCQAQKDLAPSFQKALESLLNRYCKDNASNTPDFLLAEYMLNVLDAFTTLNNKRERWYGRRTF